MFKEKKTQVVANSYFAIVADKLKQGTSIRIKVLGDSMYPLIHGGKDEILLIPHQPEEELPMWSAVFYQWGDHYMVHRYIRREGDVMVMLGDGNLYREEKVPATEIIGVLKTIFHPNGKETDCLSAEWLKRGERWYKLLPVRRYLLFILKRLRKIGLID